MLLKNMIALGVVGAFLLPTTASAQVRVSGYVNKNGTYVAPHYRSSPNSTTLDNYSTKGNYNPYTGKAGTKDPYSPRSASPNYGTYETKPSSSSCTYACSSDDGDDD